MEFNLGLGWILLGLPAAFVLGWFASRFDLRQLRLENRQAPKAYFRGLNFLLNEQQDQAIDAFIEAVQNDPDTSELHFALGNLFRRRGEYERAVRVHQHLLSRGDLNRADRDRAQHAMALDYLKAGLLDRAEEALLRLEGSSVFEEQARLALLAIYERSRDWAQAAEITHRLSLSGQGNFSIRLAHHLCEQASARKMAGDSAAAMALLLQATERAPSAPRPRIETAVLQRQLGRHREAVDTLLELSRIAPASTPLFAGLAAEASITSERAQEVRSMLSEHYQQHPSLDVLDALVQLDTALGQLDPPPRDRYVRHLEREPSLVAAARWLTGEALAEERFHPIVQRALDHAAKPLTRYRCAACGFEAKQHFWQCPGCQTWDSYPPRRVEEL